MKDIKPQDFGSQAEKGADFSNNPDASQQKTAEDMHRYFNRDIYRKSQKF